MNDAIPARGGKRSHLYIRLGTLLLAVLLLTIGALMWWWDHEPGPFDPAANAREAAVRTNRPVVVGSAITRTLARVSATLLDKRGGYVSNDKLPPGLFMDNVPNWEFGVLVQVRDLSKALRNDFSRSQTQSVEDVDLAAADPLFSSPNDRWLLPSSESQYRKGITHLDAYVARLGEPGSGGAQFYARADNLADWLAVVEKRLGSLSQRLSASAGQAVLDTDPDSTAEVGADGLVIMKTPWTQIDDVFYEARGSTWALLHFLKAVEVDFDRVLRDKNALVSLRQIIRELEETQAPLGSPMVLNGTPFGFFANHSLVMANYISRANAAIIDLRRLLERG
ncbi:DUF2333 family protein [Xanthomonadaceae bacterium JHOS43]|nr:DUF2333 family protein [Xanthomonadaceae bacterium JHOS43]